MPDPDINPVNIKSGMAMYNSGIALANCLIADLPMRINHDGVPVTLHLIGQLGAGKTTFSQGVLAGLGYTGRVKSPTYTIVESYKVDTARLSQVHHFDFYRIGDPGELELLGIRDYFTSGTLSLIEWPERADNLLPSPDIMVEISIDSQDASNRYLELQSESPMVQLWLQLWLQAMRSENTQTE